MSTATMSVPVYAQEACKSGDNLISKVHQINQLLGQQADLSHRTMLAMHELQELAESLFCSEEESAFFMETSEYSPWIVHRLTSLLEQHQQLRGLLANLSRSSDDQDTMPVGWAAIARKFAEFNDRLVKHEQAEISLWQAAYNQDVGSKD